MIPKKIHYCWFGNNPKNQLVKKCIKSWKKYCKDYEIIEWNEKNFNISETPDYVQEAYREGKWAFVTDYVRLYIVMKNGGVYLDTDIELIESIDLLLDNHAFFGMQKNGEINTGLGFGAEKDAGILGELLADYETIHFVKEDGTYDIMPCPERNYHVFLEHGLVRADKGQTLNDGSIILTSDVLSPINYETMEINITTNTISIHWYAASWKEERLLAKIFKQLFGQMCYIKVKSFLKKLRAS